MSEFAKNLRRLRKASGFTLEQLADALNVKFGTLYSKGTISKWENGADPNMDSVRNLSAFFNVTLDHLLGIKFDPDDVSPVDHLIPILGSVAAGVPLIAEQNVIGFTPCPSFVKNKNRNLFYLKVRGDSMDREFPDGSNVLVDPEAVARTAGITRIIPVIRGLKAQRT